MFASVLCQNDYLLWQGLHIRRKRSEDRGSGLPGPQTLKSVRKGTHQLLYTGSSLTRECLSFLIGNMQNFIAETAVTITYATSEPSQRDVRHRRSSLLF